MPKEITKVVNHIQHDVQVVEIIREKIVPVEKIVEVIREVPYIVEKIVDRVIREERPVIVEVQQDRLVKETEVIIAKETENHIEVKNVVVDRVVEKPVIIIQTEERFI